MDKRKKLIVSIVVILCLIIIGCLATIIYIENGIENRNSKFISTIIDREEKQYNKNPNQDTLSILCDSLLLSGEDEKIIKYYYTFLFESNENIKTEPVDKQVLYDLYLTNYFMAIYRLNGKNSLIIELNEHFNRYNIPEKKYIEMQNLIDKALFQQNNDDIENIIETFILYSEKSGNQAEIKQAYSTAEEIYGFTGNQEKYDKLKEKIESN